MSSPKWATVLSALAACEVCLRGANEALWQPGTATEYEVVLEELLTAVEELQIEVRREFEPLTLVGSVEFRVTQSRLRRSDLPPSED